MHASNNLYFNFGSSEVHACKENLYFNFDSGEVHACKKKFVFYRFWVNYMHEKKISIFLITFIEVYVCKEHFFWVWVKYMHEIIIL